MIRNLLTVVLSLVLSPALTWGQESAQPAQESDQKAPAVQQSQTETAGQSQPGLLYMVSEKVKPGHLAEYAQGVEQFLDAIKEGGADPSSFSFYASSNENFSATYAIPIRNFADVDRINKEFGQIIQKYGKARWDAMERANAEHVEFVNQFIIRYQPELSYVPKDSTNAPGPENPFCRITVYHTKPGSDDDVKQSARTIKELYRSNNVPYQYGVYQVVLGQEMPGWAVRQCAKDELTLVQMDQAIDQALASHRDELRRAINSFWQHLRHREEFDSRIRPQWSFLPQQQEQ